MSTMICININIHVISVSRLLSVSQNGQCLLQHCMDAFENSTRVKYSQLRHLR